MNDQSPAEGLLVVGIGASAGGIEAMREVLPTLPTGNVAYVVAQHMSPVHPSLLTQVLSRETALPVAEIEADMAIEPGTIFVAPVNRDVEIVHGRFQARQAAPRISPQPSINVLLESIAESYGRSAVGIVLSGTGSDGALGIQAVKGARGYTIVQEPTTARYRDMPSAALDTGAVDYVLEPAEIGRVLAAILRGDASIQLRPSGRWADDPVMGSIARETKRVTGWDISSYKDGTLGRQLGRRISTLGLNSTREYQDYIADNPDELVELRDSMLITVTGFMRDKKSFENLRGSVVTLVKAKSPGETVRAWVAGCATGEEAYSIAMMLADAVRERGNDLGVKVFATDISDSAMEVARRGVYPSAALKDVPEEWRDRYFNVEGERAQVHKHLRDMLVIARQDVTNDPPLVRMDLVTCRNLLIYLVPDIQTKVLSSFHAALNPRGLLFLGRSESVPSDSEHFATVNSPSKIYVRQGAATTLSFGLTTTPRVPVATSRMPLRMVRDVLRDELRDRMLGEFAPPSVLVDAAGTPVHQVGDVARYLGLPEGGDYTLPAMIVPSLRTELSAMLDKVLRDGVSEVAHTLVVRFPDETSETIRVQVSRFSRQGGRRVDPPEAYALVSFVPQVPAVGVAAPIARIPASISQDSETGDLLQQVTELERELVGTREHLQSVVEELESSNEELQAMNEELQASSEELQATNEELETTNEELQATNEELTTVNETLEVRSTELAETSVVLQNIQDAVHTAIVLVDNQQRVQQFSPLAVKVFGLVKSDLGTRLGALPTTVDLPDLEQRIDGVLQSGQGIITEASSAAATYLLQIMPYRDEDQVKGAVLALSDITELARARTALADISQEFRVLVAEPPTVLYRTGPDRVTLTDVSPSARELLGVSAADAVSLQEAIHPDDQDRVAGVRQRDREHDYQIDYRLVSGDGTARFVRDISRVVLDERGRPSRRVGLLLDVSDLVAGAAAD